MKFLVLILAFLSVELMLAQDDVPMLGNSMLGSSMLGANKDAKKFFGQLQNTVQTLLKATKNKQGPNSNLQYFWDMIPPLVQFILLNQTQVSNLNFNVTQKVQQNVSNLNWNVLPENVKSYLLTHEAAQILYMRFNEWGFTDAKNIFAPSTLFSLMTKKDQMQAPNVLAIVAPIHFNLKIDLTYLNETLSNDIYYNYAGGRFFQNDYLVAKFFDSLFRFVENYFDQALLPENMLRLKRQSANGIYSQAIYRAEAFILRKFIMRK